MSLWDKVRGEFIDIIEWLDSSNDTMVYRFERYGNEIKYGAKLTVRQSQVAVFVNEGQCADVFQPGMYTLETHNMPVLSTLQGWKYGFSSPFKAEVYFVNTRRFTDLKWGTKNPVMMRDPEFGPIRVRAFGTYAIRVKDPVAFIREIVGTDGHFTTGEISEQLRNQIVSRFANILAEANLPALDIARNYDKLGEFITGKMAPEFEQIGIEITNMLVENVSLPPEVEQALDRKSSMNIVGDMNRYTQFQTAEAIKAAATNPGAAGGSIGMGLGVMMAQNMGQAVGQSQAAGAAAGGQPPPIPGTVAYFVAVDGRQAGPFGMAELQTQVQSGRLTRESLVWAQGMAAWSAAGGVAALASLFAAMPPPLPPKQ
jgi:membrane protease subunit (stomatin/prohibitin family)